MSGLFFSFVKVKKESCLFIDIVQDEIASPQPLQMKHRNTCDKRSSIEIGFDRSSLAWSNLLCSASQNAIMKL